MLELFTDLKSMFLRVDKIHVDCFLFRLIRRTTVSLFVIFGIVLTAKNYLGTPIQCMMEDKFIKETILNTFCWVNPTFTITENGNQVRVLSPSYPGVVKAIGSAAQAAGGGGGADGGRPEERRYYYYYQWVSITLLVQVVFFYLPYLLWKCVEKGRIQFLTKDLQNDNFGDEKVREAKVQQLVIYLLRHYNRFLGYSFKYIACEIMTFAVLVVCIALNHALFNNRFLTYGWDIFEYLYFGGGHHQPNKTIANPMENLFPLMSKCTIYTHGPSGDVQVNNALCMLVLNVFNEKIYLVVWVWFAVALVLAICMLMTRALAILSRTWRINSLQQRCTGLADEHASTIIGKGNYGDFFILYQLCLNVDASIMADVLKRLANAIKRYDSHNGRRIRTDKAEDGGGGVSFGLNPLV